MTHHQKITRTAIAIDYPVLQERFHLKAQALECGARTGLIRCHHRRHLFHTTLFAEMENLLSQPAAESHTTILRSEQQSHFPNPARPACLIMMQAGVTNDCIANLGDNRDSPAFFEITRPFVNRRSLSNISA